MKGNLKFLQGVVFLAILLLLANTAGAMTIFSTGTEAVTSIDRNATFDTIVTGQSLAGYTEDGLLLSVDDTAYVSDLFAVGPAFSGSLYYGSGGNNSYVSITTTDGADIVGLVMGIGDGWTASSPLNITWETWKDGALVTSMSNNNLVGGEYYGFSDEDGFDELRIAAFYTSDGVFGSFQAIAIDDLRVQLNGNDAVPVPEPTTLILLGTGLIGLIGSSRKRFMQ